MPVGSFQDESEGYYFVMKRAARGPHGFSCFGVETGRHPVKSVFLHETRSDLLHRGVPEKR